jgi:hypothetical protein
MTTKPQRTRRVLLGASLLFLSMAPAPAQGLLQAEFRIDGGAAQPMSVTASNTNGTNYVESSFAASVTANNLSVGPHWLDVRMTGTNNVWCEWQSMWFRIAGETHLVAAEYFVDTDPGAGLGTPIPLPQDGAWDEPEEDFVVPGVSVTNLSEGRHSLVIRCKDSNGDWGITSQTAFYVGAPLKIVAAVWTTNQYDWGNPNYVPAPTNSMKASDGAFDDVEEQVEATVNTLALGTNYCLSRPIFVRVQDSLGRWSTRGGMYWDSASGQWEFNPSVGWTNVAQSVIGVQPETPSNPSPGDDWLLVKTNGMVTLDWNDCRGFSGYAVYLRGAITGDWSSLITTNGYTNSALTIGPLANGTYSWFVTSLGGNENECYSQGPLWHFAVTTPKAGDSDNDGIPDWWEQYYFKSLFPANGTTDRDGDGTKDWQEYAAGTNPTNRFDFFGIEGCRVVPDGIAVDWNSSSTNQIYTIYYATELAGLGTTWFIFDQLQGTGSMMSATNYWPDPKGFFTIGVRAPDLP